MTSNNHFHNSLLLLSYLIMNADGILDDHELAAITRICDYEHIPPETMKSFVKEIVSIKEKDVYHRGLDEIYNCTDDEKVRVFAWLHRISEADGNVHVKEVRFLLYSIKKAGIEFENVISASKKLPPLA